jgi:hypothetical protein
MLGIDEELEGTPGANAPKVLSSFDTPAFVHSIVSEYRPQMRKEYSL